MVEPRAKVFLSYRRADSQHVAGRAGDEGTGAATGQKVGTSYVRDFTAKSTVAGKTTQLSGTGRWRQLKKCTKQRIPLIDIRYQITLTLSP